ncbi:succinate dehydrogenase [Heliophilum fasciatum]|uniref:Succinate dehydrogenase subunit C n=1 Tax=Heliophilum fasciatum TaxID=35700 RepID=A0A4R2RSK4_9FIRM|nr:succinate dehydrogenase [Heliophilum fasciatum]MCW2277394.1 succinate dehydrogenase / fumarate reductase cytochrome b subunit [Heliophilum fasciatum]TCP67230.1 succinate dehydrogenase subunit C [Heliophilum fasciatum]
MSDKNHFLIRKLHSLLGIIPIGLFFAEHTLMNSMAMVSQNIWSAWTSFLHHLPFKTFLEMALIFIPIAFHAIYGLWIVYVAKNNALRYTYFRNWMFYLQRITAILTVIFVVWHVGSLKAMNFWGTGGSYFTQLGDYLAANPVALVAYVIGFLAAAFHFCNGIWSFLIAWGITIGPKAQQAAFTVCMALLALFSVGGIGALFALMQ